MSPRPVSISCLHFGLFDDLVLPTVCRLKIKLQTALSLTLKILPSLLNHFSLALLPLLAKLHSTMLWSAAFHCRTSSGSILGCWSWRPLNPLPSLRAKSSLSKSFHCCDFFFSTLNTYSKCYFLGQNPLAFFSSSDTIPALSVVCGSWLWNCWREPAGQTMLPHKPEQLWSSHLNPILRVDLVYLPCFLLFLNVAKNHSVLAFIV